MLKIGLLGASRIAVPAIIEPVSTLSAVTVTRVAASDSARAAAYADKYGIDDVCPGYQALVESPEVDLVYNALPPSGHRHWSIEALNSGKDVLCEKPFAMNATEAREMVACEASTGRCLIEAFHHRFHPFFDRILEILAGDELGDVRNVQAHFRVNIPAAPGELRHDPALGGGALMDLGCYPVHWIRSILGAEPQEIRAESVMSGTGVDLSTRAEPTFANGKSATLSCSMNEPDNSGLNNGLRVECTNGELVAENILSPDRGGCIRICTDDDEREENGFEGATYEFQLRHVMAVLAGKTGAITGGDDAVNNMEAIDRIYAAAGVR